MKAQLSADQDYRHTTIEAIVQATLEAEMTSALGADRGERMPARLGYGRSLITRVRNAGAQGVAGPAVAVLDRAVRALSASGETLVATLIEMYVQGVSTRKVEAVTEELCEHSSSAKALRSIDRKHQPRLYDHTVELILDVLVFDIPNAMRKSGVWRAIERRLRGPSIEPVPGLRVRVIAKLAAHAERPSSA